jgi:hypothetical protein
MVKTFYVSAALLKQESAAAHGKTIDLLCNLA